MAAVNPASIPIPDLTVAQTYIFKQDLLEAFSTKDQDVLCSDQRTYNYPDNLEQSLRQDKNVNDSFRVTCL